MNTLHHTTGSHCTGREKEVLDFICRGLTSKEIASLLDIAKNTVDNHRRNLVRKNRVKNTRALLTVNMDAFSNV